MGTTAAKENPACLGHGRSEWAGGGRGVVRISGQSSPCSRPPRWRRSSFGPA